jgi:hypothetical protein
MSAQDALARLQAAVLASPGQGLIQLSASDASVIAQALRAAAPVVPVMTPGGPAYPPTPSFTLEDVASAVQHVFEDWEHKT